MKKKTKANKNDPRRGLPSVSALLDAPGLLALIREHSRSVVKEAVRESLALIKKNLKKGDSLPGQEEILSEIKAFLNRKSVDRLRPVVNAMGIVLHTGLGRAPLPKEAAKAISGLHQCCNLQIDMETGMRGRRNYQTESLLCRLTGAEAAMVVNNNAAATFLILSVFCKGKEVIVSRGQLIEIGGSFRLPDCLSESGSIMKEVGTTNKTHLRDYDNAFSENTGAILRVHPSNYRVIGFSKSVSIAELSSLKKKKPPFVLIDDLGCGALVNLEEIGLPIEPTVPDSIADGADLACSSGDKLIGGPQAGIIVGRKELIARIKKHPMTRMLRVCKMTDLALERTLKLFLDPGTLKERHPLYSMMSMPGSRLKSRASRLKMRLSLKKNPSINVRVAEDQSAVGGGTMPDYPLDTWVLALSSARLSAERLNALLRENDPPILGRIKNNEVLLDMRTLLGGEDRIVEDAVRRIAAS